MKPNSIIIRRAMRGSYLLGSAFLLAGLILSMVGTPVAAQQEDKVYWCHYEPNGNSQTLHLPLAALINAGHVSASGSPLHAGDHEGPCETDPTEVPTQVPTEVPTQVPTEVPTQVPTQVPTEVPTQVPTEVPTQVPTENPEVEITPQPTPEDPGDPDLPPPVVQGDPAILIPVTGIDLGSSPFSSIGFFQKLSFNFGFAFMGLALVLTAVSKKMN